VFLFQGPTRGVISLCKHPSIHFLASGPIFEPSLVVVPSVFASESLKTKSDLNSSSGNLSRRQVKDPLGTPHVSCASLSPADCMSLGNPEFTRVRAAPDTVMATISGSPMRPEPFLLQSSPCC
jgi:hypothetical protein